MNGELLEVPAELVELGDVVEGELRVRAIRYEFDPEELVLELGACRYVWIEELGRRYRLPKWTNEQDRVLKIGVPVRVLRGVPIPEARP